MKSPDITIESSPFLRSIMTAAWIADQLDVKQVVIRFNLVEFLNRKSGYNSNPMNHLEFCKAKLDFEVMKQQSPEYATEEFFPESVDIVMGKDAPEVMDETFTMFPET